MTTIHLTDVQRDSLAACGLIVIDGEPQMPPRDFHQLEGRRCPRCHSTMDVQCADNHSHLRCGVCYFGAPLVAPEGWRILTEPCDTCNGNGAVLDRKLTGEPWPRHCSNCVGGLRVVTLTATCPMEWQPGWPCDGWIPDKDGDRCGKCDRCTDGVVTFGRFVLTMRALDDGRFEITPERVE